MMPEMDGLAVARHISILTPISPSSFLLPRVRKMMSLKVSGPGLMIILLSHFLWKNFFTGYRLF
jgi:CheY-like chemotaxis protein